MKSYMSPLVGLAITLALPAGAQQTKCDGPQEACQQIVDLFKKHNEASSKQDIAGIMALFTTDAVFVSEGSTLDGRDAIEKWHTEMAKAGAFGRHDSKVDQVHVQGNIAWAVGSWSDTGPSNGSHPVHGNWGDVFVLEGGTWKVRMLTANVIETPPGQAGAGQTRARSD
jgi:uncharacterized protein (TIGR02246 family)